MRVITSSVAGRQRYQWEMTPAGCSKSLSSKAAASYHIIRGGWDDPNRAQHSTRLPTGTPRRSVCPGEGLVIAQLPQREQADCSSLRASSDHCFIVGALRARRTVCLLPRILLSPRVARARGSSQLPHPPFFSILLLDDAAYKIVQGRVGDLNFDEFPCCG
jgi:hypothetical protein